MTEEHRDALYLLELDEKVTVSDDLLNKLSLCPRHRQAIERAATREQQMKMLITIVSRQPVFAFTQLHKALIDTRQTTAACSLMSCLRMFETGKHAQCKPVLTKESGKETCHKGVTLINMIFSVALRLQHV